MPAQVCAGSFMHVGEFVWMPKDRARCSLSGVFTLFIETGSLSGVH